MERRTFLRGIGATMATRALPPSLLLGVFNRSAQGADGISAILEIVNSINALSKNTDDGMNQQFMALHVKLDQILKNQVTILQAIAIVNNSIDRLSNELKGMFTHQLYHDTAIKIISLHQEINQFAELVKSDPDAVRISTTKKNEFVSLLIRTRQMAAELNSVASTTNFVGSDNRQAFFSFLKIAPAIVCLPQSMLLLFSLEGMYEDVGFTLGDYKQIAKTISYACDNLCSRIVEAKVGIEHSFSEIRRKAIEDPFFPGDKMYVPDGDQGVKDYTLPEPIAFTLTKRGIYCYKGPFVQTGDTMTPTYSLIQTRNITQLHYTWKATYVKPPFGPAASKDDGVPLSLEIMPDDKGTWDDTRHDFIQQYRAPLPELWPDMPGRECRTAPAGVGNINARAGLPNTNGYDNMKDREVILQDFLKRLAAFIPAYNENRLQSTQCDSILSLAYKISSSSSDFSFQLDAYSFPENRELEWRPFAPTYSPPSITEDPDAPIAGGTIGGVEIQPK